MVKGATLGPFLWAASLFLQGCGPGFGTQTELEGIWDTGCAPYLKGTDVALTSHLEIKGNRIRIDYSVYQNPDCTGQEYFGHLKALLTIGKASGSVDGARELDLTEYDMTAASRSVAFNWDADGFIGGNYSGSQYLDFHYTLYSLDGDQLTAGLHFNDHDGSTPDLRHVILASYSYYRVP